MVEPLVESFAAGLVAVVGGGEFNVTKIIGRLEKFVDVFEGGAFDGHGGFGPIAGGADKDLRARRGGGGDFHVRIFDAEVGHVFAKATALARVADHDDGALRGEAIVNGAEHEGLGATAGFAGAGEPMRVGIGERREEIKGAEAVPSLQAHEGNAPELRGGIIGGERGMDFSKGTVGGSIGEMGVVVADEVVGKGDHALFGEIDAAGGDAAGVGIGEAAVVPMTVGIQDSGERAGAVAEGAVEVSGEIKAGIGLEINFLDGVAVADDFIGDDGVERSFFGQGPEAAADEDLLADEAGALLPLGFAGDGGEYRGGWRGQRGEARRSG